MCGGTATVILGSPIRQGLSPRVRGNLQHTGRGILEMRSIPACAGEPITPEYLPLSEGVYPRVCGGTWARSTWVVCR